MHRWVSSIIDDHPFIACDKCAQIHAHCRVFEFLHTSGLCNDKQQESIKLCVCHFDSYIWFTISFLVSTVLHKMSIHLFSMISGSPGAVFTKGIKLKMSKKSAQVSYKQL